MLKFVLFFSSALISTQAAQNYPYSHTGKKQFKWSYDGPLAGHDCITINEPSAPPHWQDNKLCWETGYKNPGVRWSYPGMECTRIYEPSEPERYQWGDNYLCVPRDSPYQLHSPI